MTHSTGPSTRGPRAKRVNRPLRAAGLVLVLLAVTAGCGKKGPPLAPYVRVPAAVTTVTPQRIGNDVYLAFEVPSTNVDGQKPATIQELRVYGVTSELAPANEEQREVATLIATLPVRPVLPTPPPSANGSPAPAIPLPPGVDQATPVAVREALTAETRIAVELPVDKPVVKLETPIDPDAERIGPLVAPPPTQLPRRHYFVIGVSPRGRESTPSTPVSIPLEAGSSAPGAPVITNTASEMTITWTPAADARTATIVPPPPVVKPVVAANATPANITPRVPVPLPPLVAKSLGFNTEATTYHIYDVTPKAAVEGAPPPDPYAVTRPTPITAVAVVGTEHVIKGVPFGTERCFEVRPVDKVFGTPVIGPPSPAVCYTPQDTFPPVAPKSLQAIAGSGVISLIWDANTEVDLGGYIVLRGEAPGDTLQAITDKPVTVTSYRDETVKPGTRYVYAIVAVDRAVPQNVSPQSNRAEETARQ
jgi:predicted small lipoprotein YifL